MIAEKKGLYIKFDPKPVSGDWNGSGAHIRTIRIGYPGPSDQILALKLHLNPTVQALFEGLHVK